MKRWRAMATFVKCGWSISKTAALFGCSPAEVRWAIKATGEKS